MKVSSMGENELGLLGAGGEVKIGYGLFFAGQWVYVFVCLAEALGVLRRPG